MVALLPERAPSFEDKAKKDLQLYFVQTKTCVFWDGSQKVFSTRNEIARHI